MPRQRKTKATAEVDSSSNQTETNKPKGMKMPLNSEQIKALYAKRRTKGLYVEKLVEFLASEDAGVSVREQWPTDFTWDPTKEDKERGKQATTLKQGFENAKEKKDAPEGSELVDVLVDGDEVYLINKALTGEAEPAELVEA